MSLGGHGGGIHSSGGDFKAVTLPSRKCISITYDAKFCVLVEAAGDDGLRLRQFNAEAKSSLMQTDKGQCPLGEVFRYLDVPTSYVAFTPYNMMLCCHHQRLSMVRHCTGRLVYEMTLDCSEVSGVAFDSATDSFFISDSTTGCVVCMKYMEFNKPRKLELKFTVVPSGLCIFANTLLISNKSSTELFCGLCYKMEDGMVHKINRVAMAKKVTSGKQLKLADATSKEMRPSSLKEMVILPQAGAQQQYKVTMVGISDVDRTIYMYKVRTRKVSSNQVSLSFKFKARDDASFNTDQEGNIKTPRSIAALSSEYVAVYYEVCTQDKMDANSLSSGQSSGIILFRLKQI